MKVIVINVLMFLFFASICAASDDNARLPEHGRVYIATNQAEGNTVVVFHRAIDGTLTRIQEVSTGGLGSGPGVLPPPFAPGPGPDGLESQDSLILTEDGRFLLVVNAGSNDISVLRVEPDGLELVDRVPSGGAFPVSIAHHKDLFYVVNGGEDPFHPFGAFSNITGFHLSSSGKLRMIPGSTQTSNTSDAFFCEAVFNSTGNLLIVMELFADRLDVFPVDEDGVTHGQLSMPSNSPSPLAAAFGNHNILAVTEIDEEIVPDGRRVGRMGASSVSTYRLTGEGTLQTISKSIPTHQTASCWIRFTPDGRFAFTGDSGSGTISTLSVSPRGEITLTGATFVGGAGVVSGPLDLDITPDGKFLYILASFVGGVKGYRIEADGTLVEITSVSGFPITVAGMIAR